jgi:hypothetical protein
VSATDHEAAILEALDYLYHATEITTIPDGRERIIWQDACREAHAALVALLAQQEGKP